MPIEEVWYGGSAAAAAARTSLVPLSALFGAAARLRGALYDRGVLAVASAPAPVVSIGGLRVGGSGKTPFAIWLAARLVERGLRPCIVTRGYGGRGADRPAFVLRGGELTSDAAIADAAASAGDEAVLLALRSGCPVAVGRDRFAACEMALRELAAAAAKPDLFVLDDGFQHRALARALDVVLVDGDEDHLRLLPAGPLRERPSALVRADALVVMGGAGASRPPAIAADALVLRAATTPQALVSAVGDVVGEDVATLAGRRVVAVAAIARPGRFLRDLERAGAKIVASVLRRDHHRFDQADCREIDAAAASADLVVTTEKDLVKLAQPRLKARVRALRIDVRVEAAAAQAALIDRVASLAAFDR